MAPLIVLIVGLGVYPKPVLDRIAPSVDELVTHVEDHSDFEAAGRARRSPPADAGSLGAWRRSQPLPPLETPDVEWGVLAPELILIGGALILLVAGTFARRRDDRQRLRRVHRPGGVAVAGRAPSGCGRTSPASGARPRLAVADAVSIDGFAVFVTVVILVAVVLGALLADDYLRREGLDGARRTTSS